MWFNLCKSVKLSWVIRNVWHSVYFRVFFESISREIYGKVTNFDWIWRFILVDLLFFGYWIYQCSIYRLSIVFVDLQTVHQWLKTVYIRPWVEKWSADVTFCGELC